MKNLILATRSVFQKHFTSEPQLMIQAPGRVNLIGEHTDYNDGFVLPCAINYCTVIASEKRDDHKISVVAVDYQNQSDVFSLKEPIVKHPVYGWANYVRGVIKHMQKYYPKFGGMNLVISGNVPLGAGLSSSASLEVSLATTIKTLYDLPLETSKLALICQEAENQFVGCNCGIMDQFISAMGRKDHALLIDCRNLSTQSISLPKNIAIVIINSNVKHGLVDSEYNDRRKQCEKAAQILGVSKLRDATLEQLEAAKNKMDHLIYKRAHHVITENDRTLAAAKYLANNDLVAMGHLMAQSHASMRDDFEITVDPINKLVDIVKEVIGEHGGVRMTGGGFGGCVVTLIPEQLVEPVQKSVAEKYEAQTGLKESFYICTASDGASIITSH